MIDINKKFLVTGGTGMIGMYIIEELILMGVNPSNITVVSLDSNRNLPSEVCFKSLDLREFNNCKEAVKGMNYVFNLIGIKGSPKMSTQNPASFMVPMLQFNTNMMEAARLEDVDWYAFTSSVGVYAPAEVFKEDDVWKTFPSPNDKHPGWAKRIGELQADAYSVQYKWNRVSIIRPANVYGRYDNFDPENAMVVPSIISRIINGENPLKAWGDGSPIRDFVHARDVARCIIYSVEKQITEPLNSGSGEENTIKNIVEGIVAIFNEQYNYNISIEWDITKPSGDAKRLMDMTRTFGHGFKNIIGIRRGILDTVKWYLENKEKIPNRYNVFKENNYI